MIKRWIASLIRPRTLAHAASFAYTDYARGALAADANLGTADIRLVLVMTNTTFDTDRDITTLGATATPDYYDGANHDSTNGHAFTSEAVAADNANDRGEFTAAAITFTALGAGTRQAQGAVMFRWVTNIGSSKPIAFIDSGGFPFAGNGGNVTFTPNAEGLLQATT